MQVAWIIPSPFSDVVILRTIPTKEQQKTSSSKRERSFRGRGPGMTDELAFHPDQTLLEDDDTENSDSVTT